MDAIAGDLFILLYLYTGNVLNTVVRTKKNERTEKVEKKGRAICSFLSWGGD